MPVVGQVRARLRPDLVAQHAEVFLINGDMNSNLYTSSRAMHSAILGLLQPEGSGLARAGVGRLQNLSVSVQRRWANVLSDATRQVQHQQSPLFMLPAGAGRMHAQSSARTGPWASLGSGSRMAAGGCTSIQLKPRIAR